MKFILFLILAIPQLSLAHNPKELFTCNVRATTENGLPGDFWVKLEKNRSSFSFVFAKATLRAKYVLVTEMREIDYRLFQMNVKKPRGTVALDVYYYNTAKNSVVMYVAKSRANKDLKRFLSIEGEDFVCEK
jgi:hypothetical protein